MIPRRSPTAEDVAAALATDEVTDIEERHRPGAWGSVFHAFRAERRAPSRPWLVSSVS